MAAALSSSDLLVMLTHTNKAEKIKYKIICWKNRDDKDIKNGRIDWKKQKQIKKNMDVFKCETLTSLLNTFLN